jgi:hypothetical protein
MPLFWESECLVNNCQKIDFRLRLLEETVVIEAKAAPTRYKDGKPYPLPGYYSPNCDREIPKMLAVQANSYYLLIFAYPAAPANDWNVLAKKIEGRRPGYTVTVSRVDESPELSIGWLEVENTPASMLTGGISSLTRSNVGHRILTDVTP